MNKLLIKFAQIIFVLCCLLMTVEKSFAADKPIIYPQLAHTGALLSIAFSPDGKLALSGSYDETLKLWELSTGRDIRTFNGHTSSIYSVDFSSDGSYAVSGSLDKTIMLWDVRTGKTIRTMTVKNAWVRSVAFSPDSKVIASGWSDDVIRLWNVANGKMIGELIGHNTKCDNDDSWCKTGTTTGVYSVNFSSDSKYLVSSGSDKKILLWNVKYKKIIKKINGHEDIVHSVKLSRDNKFILSGSEDKTIRLWDIKSGKEIHKFLDRDKVFSVVFGADGKYALSGGLDGKVRQWDLIGGEEIAVFSDQSSAACIHSVALSPDGSKILAGNLDGTATYFNLKTGNNIFRLGGELKIVSAIAISKDGNYSLTGSRGGKFDYWKIHDGEKIKTFIAEQNSEIVNKSIASIALSSDGKIALASNPYYVMLLNIEEGKLIRKFVGHDSGVFRAYFSPDDKFALSGSMDGTAKLWDIHTGSLVRSFEGHNSFVLRMAFSADGKYVLTGSKYYNTGYELLPRKTIILWDAKNGREIKSFKEQKHIELLKFSSDSRYIFSGGDGTLIKWDVINGNKIWLKSNFLEPELNFNNEYALTLSKKNNNKLNLIDISNDKNMVSFYSSSEFVFYTFSHDSNRVISRHNDGTFRLWDVKTGAELVQFVSFSNDEWISITPDGYYNASPNGDKHLNVRIGNNVYGIENYRETFFRPDLVKIALSGGSLKGYLNLADVKQAPQIEIFDTPLTVSGDELSVKLKLTDTGGGIGDVRLYLNGSAVKLDATRGLKAVNKVRAQGIIRSYTIRLARGDNIIRAVAFNAENTMQSNPAEHTVTATFTPKSKPTLHALVVGINEFKNPKLRLQYAVPDADLFSQTLHKGASGLFGKVNIIRLTTPEQTTSDSIAAELNKLQSINPEDLFILFVASHGTVDDGEYFLITSNVGSTSTVKLKTDALSQEKIKSLVANIPATKKVIVLDTCNAGQMSDSLQMAMLTRGMSEDTAFKILSRAVGSTILSSATSTQEALEGYKGHGLFTWVLTEGMQGKADKGKTGLIKTNDLVDYVESVVPEIAERYFKRKQYPTTAVSGQGFPIGKNGL